MTTIVRFVPGCISRAHLVDQLEPSLEPVDVFLSWFKNGVKNLVNHIALVWLTIGDRGTQIRNRVHFHIKDFVEVLNGRGIHIRDLVALSKIFIQICDCR